MGFMSNILLDRFQAGSLPQAILLIGSSQGATSVVLDFIEQLNLNVADYLILEAGESIKMADAKRIKAFIQMTRFTSPIKPVFIADASVLTPEAANALLKTLEEPPEGSHLILATTRIDTLLPTIRSRCHVINLDKTEVAVGDIAVPRLVRQDLASAFQMAKELAASDLALPAIFSHWSQQLAGEAPTEENRRWQAIVLDYLGPAQTSVNRRLLLDNFCLEIYNSD